MSGSILHRAVAAVALTALLSSAGCTAAGNVLLPPHPNSERESTPRLEVSCPLAAAAGAAFAGAVAISVAREFLEKEAQRYRASWSAAGSTHDLATCRAIRADGDRYGSLSFEIESTGEALRVVNARFEASGSRSKVISFPPRSWWKAGRVTWPESTSGKLGTALGIVNPLLWLHFGYGLIDPGIYRVDLVAKIRVVAIGEDRRVQDAELVLPLGPIPIDEFGRQTTRSLRENLSSGYFPRPRGAAFPANVTVTLLEANDLGDVIGKSAGLVDEERGALEDLLGGD